MPGRKPSPKLEPLPHAITFTLAGAAAVSGLSVSTLRRRAKDKEKPLRFVRVGGRTLVDGDSLRRLLGVS